MPQVPGECDCALVLSQGNVLTLCGQSTIIVTVDVDVNVDVSANVGVSANAGDLAICITARRVRGHGAYNSPP